MTARALPALAVLLLALAPPPARAAETCDGLTARMIRTTGASLAGREGSLAVFRAADADRMSLDCGKPARMAFGSREREPRGGYFVLIGLAARGLTGTGARTGAGAVETLARRLHQDSLLTGEPQAGRAGPAALRCETGTRETPDLTATRCVLVRARPPVLRRRAGLFPGPRAG